jgi:hypothetical protein
MSWPPSAKTANAVTKGCPKNRTANLTKSTAESPDPAIQQGKGCGTQQDPTSTSPVRAKLFPDGSQEPSRHAGIYLGENPYHGEYASFALIVTRFLV